MIKISAKPVRATALIAAAFLLLLTLPTTGCYYDKEEILYPDTACDTTAVTYSGSVAAVLSSNCNVCHGGSTPSASIKLDVYSGVKLQVDNGRLIGVVTHNPNYSPMPKNGTKLSDCNIAKIRKWIAAGAPNN
jgi:mono/diheme cytochrome c family protein